MLSEGRGGTSVENFCNHLHASLAPQLNYASVWGRSAKHYPQRCGLQHLLQDEDVVQLTKKKVKGAEKGDPDDLRGRFRTSSAKEPARIADRVKKEKLKT